MNAATQSASQDGTAPPKVETASPAESKSERILAYLVPNFTLRLVEHFHRAKINALREKE